MVGDAVRDVGLLVGAVALARLAQARHDARIAAEDARWSALRRHDEAGEIARH